MPFIKLSETSEFKIKSVGNYVWKKWDVASKKMLSSPTYVEGYKKIYPVETEAGTLDLTSGQLATLLGEAFAKVEPNMSYLASATFEVKTNGKTGKDENGVPLIRYYFNFKGYDGTQPLLEDNNDEDIPY